MASFTLQTSSLRADAQLRSSQKAMRAALNAPMRVGRRASRQQATQTQAIMTAGSKVPSSAR